MPHRLLPRRFKGLVLRLPTRRITPLLTGLEYVLPKVTTIQYRAPSRITAIKALGYYDVFALVMAVLLWTINVLWNRRRNTHESFWKHEERRAPYTLGILANVHGALSSSTSMHARGRYIDQRSRIPAY